MKVGTLHDVLDRAAVIGDIHGRLDLLDALLAKLPDERPVFFIGDLIDRGPDSRGVIDRLIQIGARGVCGNHDLWFRDFVAGEPVDPAVLEPRFGGAATLKSYGLAPTRERLSLGGQYWIDEAHRDFILALPHAMSLTVAEQEWWLIHAGPPPMRADPPDTLEQLVHFCGPHLLWCTSPITERPALARPVIMGHVPLPEPQDLGHLIAIDTGAGTLHTGGLTALLLPERDVLRHVAE